MTDLDAAIRAKLDRQRDTMVLDDMFVSDITGDWQSAFEAVLELHKCSNDRRLQGCTECSATEVDRDWTVVPYPCPTIRAIAEKLGVEA